MAETKKKEPKELVVQLKAKVTELRGKSKDVRSDTELRRARKKLKRAQRLHRSKIVLSIPDQLARSQKLMDLVNARIDVMTKTAKKPSTDAHVHSLRKRTRSLNKRMKRLNRRQEKLKKQQAPPPAEGAPPAAAS